MIFEEEVEEERKSIETANLIYIGEIQSFKFSLYNFASVFKQSLSFGRVEFKYYSNERDNYMALLSVLTSNLITLEVHSFHDKFEYCMISQDIVIKLFRLQESQKFILETFKTIDKYRKLSYTAALYEKETPMNDKMRIS